MALLSEQNISLVAELPAGVKSDELNDMVRIEIGIKIMSGEPSRIYCRQIG